MDESLEIRLAALAEDVARVRRQDPETVLSTIRANMESMPVLLRPGIVDRIERAWFGKVQD